MKKSQEKITEKMAWGEEPEANSCNVSVAFNWYNAIVDKKDCKKYLIEYVKKNKEFGVSFTKNEKDTLVKKIKSVDDFTVKLTGTIARMIDLGWDKDTIINKKENTEYSTLEDYVTKGLSDLPEVNNSIEIEETEKPKNVVSVQDRMHEKYIEYISYMEGKVDDFIGSGYIDEFDTLKYCIDNNIPAITINKLESFYDKQFKEIELVCYGKRDKKNKNDPQFDQLEEAYDFMTKPQLKKYYKFLEKIVDDFRQAYALKKSNKKVKVKKVKPIDKIVGKLKYLKEDYEFKVKSLDPSKIIGMQELWVWDPKNCKLGIYYSNDPAGFNVKGTTLQNFSDERSVQKKIRKPKELWNICKGKRSRALNKYFNSSKTKEYPLTGRFNDGILIVNAF